MKYLSNLFVFDKIFGLGITMFDETNFLSTQKYAEGSLNSQNNFASAEHCHYWVHCA